MKAVIYHGVLDIKVEEKPEPKVKKNEVLVKFKAGSLCGSDMRFYKEGINLTPPVSDIVLGHDASGQVIETGQRVAVDPVPFCGSCRMCSQGKQNLCTGVGMIGASMGYDRDGFFSELIVVPKENVYPLPQEISYDEGAVLEPVALALHTFDLLRPEIDDWVTIIGQGGIGLMLTQMARINGCRVIVSDLLDYRLEMAGRFGAEICLNPTRDDVAGTVNSLTETGSDVVIEAAGNRDTGKLTSSLIRPAGKVALVGTRWAPEQISNEATFFHVDTWTPNDKKVAISMVSRGIINVKDLISHKFPLVDFDKAIGTALDPSKKPLRIVIQS